MKKKLTRIWGVGLVVVLLVSLFAFAAPASAGTLEYSKIPTPSAVHYQINGTSDASFVRVASDGTIFAVDTQPASDIVYKSVNGGFSWTASTALGFDCADLELSPDYANDSTLFALKGTLDAVQVYISTNGGAKFNPLGGAIASSGGITGTDLAVSPMYTSGSGEVMVGTSDNGTTQYGDVYLWGATGVLNWVAQGLNKDVTTVAFSPNYPIDATYLAIGSNATDTYLDSKVSTNAWNSLAGYPVNLTPTGITAVTEAEITGSAIAFASDWNGSIPTLQRSFVALRSSNADDDVRRITGTTSVVGLAPEGGGDQEYISLAYTGDYNNGTLFAGAAGAAQVRRSANPTQPSPAWYAATKAPTGATNTYIELDPDYATNNSIWAGTVGTESAVSASADGGVNFDQTGLIDTAVASINRVALADANTYFMTTATGTASVESLWKKAGMDWVRINAEFNTTGEAAGVVLSPNYATDSTLYYYDIGGTTIRMSTDGGASFSNRIAASAIADLMPTDGYTLYLGTGINVRKSGNGGWTWGPPKATTVGGGVNMLTWDSATGHLFAGGTAGKISRSTDGGNTWADVGGPGPAGGGGAVLVAVDPNYAENNTVYANDANVAGIWRNVIGPGSTWQQIDAGTVTMPSGTCVGLTLDASGVMYAADSTAAATGTPNAGGIMRTLNPRAPFGNPVNNSWEVSSVDDLLAANSTLSGLALTSGSNQIVVIENSGPDQLLGFTDTIVGVAPALVSPEDGAISTGAADIRIAWEQVAGAKSYKYEVDTRSDFKSAASAGAVGTVNDPVANATVTNLQEGKTYYWRVRAETPVIGPWSESRTITTQITTAANAPAITSPARGGTGAGGYDAPLQPLFQWSSLKWATGYEFQLAKDPSFTDIVVNKTGADALPATTVYQPVTSLDYNTTYYWRVRGIGASTETDWSPVVGFTTMAEPVAPAPPVVVEEVPPPVIEIPPAQPPPQINIPPAPEAPAPIAPAYIWAVIVIGAILVIAVVVLIVRTRRSV